MAPIGLKCVYKVKNTGTVWCCGTRHTLWQRVMCSARGVDYDEVFAPAACLEFVRLLLALATCAGWDVHHKAVKSTFLTDKLQEEVYIAQCWDTPFLDKRGKCYALTGSTH